jgi:hypothetical protein
MLLRIRARFHRHRFAFWYILKLHIYTSSHPLSGFERHAGRTRHVTRTYISRKKYVAGQFVAASITAIIGLRAQQLDECTS